MGKIPKPHALCLSILLVALAASCVNTPSPLVPSPTPLPPTVASPTMPSPRRLASAQVWAAQTWAYQLQSIDPAELAALDVDLIVMDYASNDGAPFSRQQIDQIRAGHKIVLSYLSVGEAEVYRPYWEAAWGGSDCPGQLSADAPGWLDPSNPEWCGNYPVQFWRPEWQSIIIAYLDTILSAGFDGVYLDRVDTFYYWLGQEDQGQSFVNVDAPQQMADLVRLIVEHGRQQNPHFIVVPQNAASIIEYLSPSQQDEYLGLIDGIGVEDTFFYPEKGAETGEDAPYNPQADVLDRLAQYQQAGIPVFAVDYVTEPEKIERFFSEARARGFIPYAAPRLLDHIGTLSQPAQ